MDTNRITECNAIILARLSEYLSDYADCITQQMIADTVNTCHMSTDDAFRTLITGILDLYDEPDIRDNYVRHMFRLLSTETYVNNSYYRTVKLREPKVKGTWSVEQRSVKPYEAFVYNDLKQMPDGRILPQIGYFDKEFIYPCICENGREWMTVTPNEIETMKRAIAEAYGDVVTYGLGLGYFAFMCSEKPEVASVTVVECDEAAIALFVNTILPQFPCREKIHIIHSDAFEYAAQRHICDFVFADIWHDPLDGIDAYIRLKQFECDGVHYAYWIEDTLLCYM